MGDHEFSDRVLALICRRGVYEILRLLDNPSGVATYGQIAGLRVPRAPSLLRALAAERFVTTATPGTWDLNPNPGERIELTALGHELVGHLNRLDEWAQECRKATADSRVRLWRHSRRQS
jgi:DNA-binding HxlR family transcriptional regulator